MERGRRPGTCPRLARDDPAFVWVGSHETDLSLSGTRFSAYRRGRQSCATITVLSPEGIRKHNCEWPVTSAILTHGETGQCLFLGPVAMVLCFKIRVEWADVVREIC